MKHFLALDMLELAEIEKLIKQALQYKKTESYPQFSEKYIANLFFENSTRTKVSFEVAQRKAGMQVIPFDVSTSSVQKGETLYDTVKTLESIGCDAVVIRSSESKYYDALLGEIKIPIINGGDGASDHPSQSLLDLMTIQENFETIKGLKIVIVGDVLHSRVAHSNIDILQRMGAKIYVAAPKPWQDAALKDVTYCTLDEIIPEVDIVMLLRCQFERHTATYDCEDFLSEYGLTPQRAERMKNQAIIMHPAPVNRNVEIADELVESPKSRIFEQMKNGMFARVAILSYVFEK